ncbi:MAG: hypothetical protein Tsb0015_13400 [Simkaniaceae bacterium]
MNPCPIAVSGSVFRQQIEVLNQKVDDNFQTLKNLVRKAMFQLDDSSTETKKSVYSSENPNTHNRPHKGISEFTFQLNSPRQRYLYNLAAKYFATRDAESLKTIQDSLDKTPGIHRLKCNFYIYLEQMLALYQTEDKPLNEPRTHLDKEISRLAEEYLLTKDGSYYTETMRKLSLCTPSYRSASVFLQNIEAKMEKVRNEILGSSPRTSFSQNTVESAAPLQKTVFFTEPVYSSLEEFTQATETEPANDLETYVNTLLIQYTEFRNGEDLEEIKRILNSIPEKQRSPFMAYAADKVENFSAQIPLQTISSLRPSDFVETSNKRRKLASNYFILE